MKRFSVLLLLALCALLGFLFWPDGGSPGPAGLPGPDAREAAPTSGEERRTNLEAADALPSRTTADVSAAAPAPGLDGTRTAAPWTLLARLEVDADAACTGAVLRAYRGRATDRSVGFDSLMELGATGGTNTEDIMLRIEGEPLASAEIDPVTGRFELRIAGTRHVRLALEHRFYGLVENVPVHAPVPRTAPTQTPSSTDSYDIGTLPSYCGGHVLGRVLSDDLPSDATVRLTAEPDPLAALRDPQAFLAHSLRGGGNGVTPKPDGSFEFRAVVPATAVALQLRSSTLHGRVPPAPLLPGEVREVLLVPDPTGTAKLRIQDTGGAPLEGATVSLLPNDATGQFTLLRSARGATADADGLAEQPGLAPGSWLAKVEHVGYLPAAVDLEIKAESTSERTITLDRGPVLVGIVRNAEGDPVEDARVALWAKMEVPVVGDVTRFAGTAAIAQLARRSPIRTDAEGRFEIGGAADDRSWSLAVYHEDYAAQLATATDAATHGTPAEIVLERHAHVAGIAVDTDGQPVVEFTARISSSGMLFFSQPVAVQRLDADAEGRFELERIPPGEYQLEIEAADNGGSAARSVQVEAGQLLDVGTMTVLPPCTARGRVVDHEGLPIAGATVRRSRGGLGDNPVLGSFLRGAKAVTDAEGAFELTPLDPGAVVLLAETDQAASGRSAPLRLEPGETRDGIELMLDPGGTIEGVVLGLSGADAIAGSWQVLCTQEPQTDTRTAELQPDGTFRFEHLSPGSYQVQAMNTARMARMNSDLIRSSTSSGVPDVGKLMREMQDLMLTERARLRGSETVRVELDLLDLAAEGVSLEVRLQGAGDLASNALAEITNVGSDGSEAVHVRFVDGTTLFVDGLRPGIARLQLRAGMTMAAVGDPLEIELPEGRDFVERNWQLPAGRISGEVVHADDGTPVAGAAVRLIPEARSSAGQAADPGFALTGPDGRFRFAALPPGSYSVLADEKFLLTGTGEGTARIEGIQLAAGEQREDILLRVMPGAGIRVQVTGPGGVPVPQARVLVVDNAGNPATALPIATRTDGEGRARFAGVATGELRVIAWLDGLAPGVSRVQQITANAASAAPVDFHVELRTGTAVAAQLVDGDGRPLGGAGLALRFGGSPWVPALLFGRTVDPNGQIELGALPAGPVEFSIRHPRASFEVRRTVPTGRRAALVLSQ